MILKGTLLEVPLQNVNFYARSWGYFYHCVKTFLPPAYGVRGKVMFWQASVLPSIHLSVHRGGQVTPPGGSGNPPGGGLGTPRGGGGGSGYPPEGGYPVLTTTQNDEKLHIFYSDSLVILSIWAHYVWRDMYRWGECIWTGVIEDWNENMQ